MDGVFYEKVLISCGNLPVGGLYGMDLDADP